MRRLTVENLNLKGVRFHDEDVTDLKFYKHPEKLHNEVKGGLDKVQPSKKIELPKGKKLV